VRERVVVVLAYSVAALALATQWTAAKVAMNVAPPLELSAVRFALASVVLVVLAAITRTPLPLARWRPVAAAATFGFLGFNALAFLGLRLTPASDAALIVPTTIPVATALLATLIRERLTSRKILGFVVSSIGAAIVVIGGQRLGTDVSQQRLIGDVLELASALSWAACLTISALVVRTRSVLGFVTLCSLIGTALLLPFGLFEHGYRDVAAWGPDVWVAAASLAVVSTVLAFLIFFWAVSRFGAGLAAIISYLGPPAGVVIAVAVLGERVSALQLVGALVILAGVGLATRVPLSRPRTAATPRAPSPH
jgi:drug/metabolite transporter (DMT)-like permease